jgi:hypothetical protein
MTKDDIQMHQFTQSDIRQALQALTPYACSEHTDPETKRLAAEKAREIIAKVSVEVKETIVRPLSSLGARA